MERLEEKEKKLPVPRHLEEIFLADADQETDYGLEGRLECTCGCGKFRLKTYGLVHEDGCLGVARYEEGYALAIQAECRECKKIWPVFDMSRHGYNGYVCREGVEVPDSKLRTYHCPKCGKEEFLVEISLELEDREQFVEEVVAYEPDVYSEEDYVDAFDWIIIPVTCAGCGHRVKDWVNFETS